METGLPDVIVIVLGAQNDPEGNLSDMAVERAKGALREYRNRRGAKLLLTSSYGHFNRAVQPHACYMARYLQDHGVPPDDILPFVESVNTVEDAAYAAGILAGFKPESACVVTSEFHVPRARLIFEHFFDADCLEFVGTPDGISGAELERHRKHEAEAQNRIIAQGGVLFEGKMHTRKDNLLAAD